MTKDIVNNGQGRIYVVSRNTIMQDSTDTSMPKLSHVQPALPGKRNKRLCVQMRTYYPKNDDVGLDSMQIDLDASQLCQAFRQPSSIRVIFSQPVNHMLQGDNPSCGNNASLAHTAA